MSITEPQKMFDVVPMCPLLFVHNQPTAHDNKLLEW